jgi:phosphoglycerol geranylgeranyltransferase
MVKKGKVLEYLHRKLEREKLHMTLLDPDKQEPTEARDITRLAVAAGTDAIMVGGSTGVSHDILDKTVLAIKQATSLPVILFPTSSRTLSKHADAIYFMSMLNSKNLRFVVDEHRKAAPVIKRLGIEPIPMGYIIVAPGMKVGEVGEAEVVQRDDPESAVGYALAAEYLGMDLIYLEAGSGAPEPVPASMIRAVKEHISVPLIVGGGIRITGHVRQVMTGGADIIVTGTIVEETSDIEKKLSELITVVKGG